MSHRTATGRTSVITIEIDDDDEEEKEKPPRETPMPVPSGYRRRYQFESPLFDDPVTGLRPATPSSSDDDEQSPQQQSQQLLLQQQEVTEDFDDSAMNTETVQTEPLHNSSSRNGNASTSQWKPFPVHSEYSVWSLLTLLERKINSDHVSYDPMEARLLARLSAKYAQLEKKPV